MGTFTSFAQELSRLYSEQRARDVARQINGEAKISARKWLKDARAVPLGDEYELYRCSVYPGWLQRFDGLW